MRCSVGRLVYRSPPVSRLHPVSPLGSSMSPVARPARFDGFLEGALVGSFGGTNLFITYTGGDGNDVTLFTQLSGDYNQNGVLDAADYTVWRNHVGTTNMLPNDLIGGTIGYAQYNQWRSHYGQTAGSGAGAIAIAEAPEPASAVMLFLGAMGLHCRRRLAISQTHVSVRSAHSHVFSG